MNTDTASSAAANSATSMTVDGDGPVTTVVTDINQSSTLQ